MRVHMTIAQGRRISDLIASEFVTRIAIHPLSGVVTVTTPDGSILIDQSGQITYSYHNYR